MAPKNSVLDNESVKEFVRRFITVRELGWVPSHRKNNTGIGKTLEDLMQIDENIFGLNREFLMELLGKNNIHTRPVWFLNHLQRPFKKCQSYQIDMANHLLNVSLCLPSGSNVTNSELKKIIRIIIN